ncbi:MAG: pitrilysin family protein [Flavisolibacter sp.]
MEKIKTLDRTQSPAIKDAVDFNLKLKPFEKHNLNNGVDVYVIDAGAEEVIQLEWVFFAGNWFEKKNLVAASTNYLLKNGTTQKNAFQVNEHFEYFGSYLNRTCSNETATVTLHCLNKHLEVLLPVVREIMRDCVFPEEEIDVYKQNMRQRLKVNMKKCDFVAGRLIDAYLYGEHHPYGRYTRYEDFENITRQELLDFYRQHYVQGRMVIFVAGKIPTQLFALLNKNFGDLDNSKAIISSIGLAPAPTKKYRITNDDQGVQGAIRIGTPFPNRHHPDFLKAQVLNNLLGGFFGSRLMSNIRENKGYTYGIYSYLENHMQQSAWIISTEAGKDVCEPTIIEVYKEMEGLRNNLVKKDELLLVKNYMMGSILGDLDGPFHIINRWKTIILNELQENYFQEQINTIRGIKSKEILQLANKYLLPENFYELVVI